MPGDPTENIEERLEQYRRVRDQNVENILAQTPFDDEAAFWDEIRAGEDITLEVDLADFIVILSELESAAHRPDNAIGHAHLLDLFVQLNEDHADDLAAYVEERNQELNDMMGGGRGFQ